MNLATSGRARPGGEPAGDVGDHCRVNVPRHLVISRRDLVGFHQHTVWLSQAELEQLIAELRQAILPRLANDPAPDRARYLLSPILFPLEPPAAPEPE